MTEEINFLDCRGLNCPLPVLNISKKMKSLESGSQLNVYTTDPLSELDIILWAEKTNNKVLSMDNRGEFFDFFIKKG